jgi:hypothetical protein
MSAFEARRIAANIALGIESDDVVNYTFPKNWPADREQRARIIGEWLQIEAWPEEDCSSSVARRRYPLNLSAH